ncbi:MAG: hypothetical protein MK106_13765 [Mariniblastus sp.]|nr:hypothetical protein [Mariniblastus sp.]
MSHFPMVNPEAIPSDIGFQPILNKAIRGTLNLKGYQPNLPNGKSQSLRTNSMIP